MGRYSTYIGTNHKCCVCHLSASLMVNILCYAVLMLTLSCTHPPPIRATGSYFRCDISNLGYASYCVICSFQPTNIPQQQSRLVRFYRPSSQPPALAAGSAGFRADFGPFGGAARSSAHKQLPQLSPIDAQCPIYSQCLSGSLLAGQGFTSDSIVCCSRGAMW